MLDAIGISFEPAVPLRGSAQNRADIACFVGFVRRSAAFLAQPAERQRLPASLSRWLREQGLIDVPGAPPELVAEPDPSLPKRLHPRVRDLLQLPVPIDSWSTFVDWFEAQPLAAGPADGSSGYLAAAVRSFFAQGGRKCIVVRAGDPLPLTAPRAQRLSLIAELIPAWAGDTTAQSPMSPANWRGIGHLLGLPEASFLCLPDLPALLANEPPRLPNPPEPPPVSEHFTECSQPGTAPPPRRAPFFAAPRLDDVSGYAEWGCALNMAARFLAENRADGARKDVQLVAAVPLPGDGSPADRDLLSALLEAGVLERLDTVMSGAQPGVSSAHVQLAYPWLVWEGSAELPERLEPPDGALLGILARQTLLSGAFVSCADQPLRHVQRLQPQLSQPQIRIVRQRNLEPGETADARFLSLRQRVSLFSATPAGLSLMSDVTTSADDAWRPASVNRLMSIWVRALRHSAEDFVFEPSNELLWADVRRRLEFVGERLFAAGALKGANPQEAFDVRCDRQLMTQRDLDAGRLIAEVQFRPALPIEGITVALALSDARQILIRQVA